MRSKYRQSLALIMVALLASLATAGWAAERANLESLRLAIEDLARAFPANYTQGADFLKRLEALEERLVPGADIARLDAEFTAL
jgi:hypothetical protein